jgi:hypothetical protein
MRILTEVSFGELERKRADVKSRVVEKSRSGK